MWREFYYYHGVYVLQPTLCHLLRRVAYYYVLIRLERAVCTVLFHLVLLLPLLSFTNIVVAAVVVERVSVKPCFTLNAMLYAYDCHCLRCCNIAE